MAWWLLYDVLKEMEEEQTGNVDFHIKGGMGDDHITFRDGVGTIYDPNVAQDNIELGIESNKVRVKYGEDEILQKASDYINSTYSSHYTNEGSNIQTLDLIESVGDAEAFCRSNAIKYLRLYCLFVNSESNLDDITTSYAPGIIFIFSTLKLKSNVWSVSPT